MYLFPFKLSSGKCHPRLLFPYFLSFNNPRGFSFKTYSIPASCLHHCCLCFSGSLTVRLLQLWFSYILFSTGEMVVWIKVQSSHSSAWPPLSHSMQTISHIRIIAMAYSCSPRPSFSLSHDHLWSHLFPLTFQSYFFSHCPLSVLVLTVFAFFYHPVAFALIRKMEY